MSDDYLAKAQAIIDECGVMIQAVGAGKSEAGENEPQFAYTVGLARLSHPELIAFGLPMEVTHHPERHGRSGDRRQRPLVSGTQH